MSRYFIEVSYKGTNYSGFQVQENAITIQSEVEKALKTLHRSTIQLTGSSRTDAGVHAHQNYFHFDFEPAIHPQAVYKLNAILPHDIVVRNIHYMPPQSHSRFDAVSREYIYRIHRFKNPFLRDTSLYYPYQLDINKMAQGAAYLLTQRDFSGFSKTNSQVKSNECKIVRCDWVENCNELRFTIEANRFLRGMVRLLTGTLLKLGRQKISMQEFQSFFLDKRKTAASSPAHGLYLNKVSYPQNYFPF